MKLRYCLRTLARCMKSGRDGIDSLLSFDNNCLRRLLRFLCCIKVAVTLPPSSAAGAAADDDDENGENVTQEDDDDTTDRPSRDADSSDISACYRSAE